MAEEANKQTEQMENKVNARMVEDAISPILFTYQDLISQLSLKNDISRRKPTIKRTKSCWQWYCSLPSIDKKRAALAFPSSSDFFSKVTSMASVEMAWKKKQNNRKLAKNKSRLALGFTEISEKDRKVLSSLGDDLSLHSEREYFPLEKHVIISDGLGIELGLKEQINGLEAGLELFNALRVSCFDPQTVCLDVNLLENDEKLASILDLASFGGFFRSEDNNWMPKEGFSLGAYISSQIEAQLNRSMLNNTEELWSIRDASLSNCFWTNDCSKLMKSKITVSAIREFMIELKQDKSISEMERLRMLVDQLGTPSISTLGVFYPLSTVLTTSSSSHNPNNKIKCSRPHFLSVLSQCISNAWRESVEKELSVLADGDNSSLVCGGLTSLNSSSVSKSAKKKKKAIRSQQQSQSLGSPSINALETSGTLEAPSVVLIDESQQEPNVPLNENKNKLSLVTSFEKKEEDKRVMTNGNECEEEERKDEDATSTATVVLVLDKSTKEETSSSGSSNNNTTLATASSELPPKPSPVMQQQVSKSEDEGDYRPVRSRRKRRTSDASSTVAKSSTSSRSEFRSIRKQNSKAMSEGEESDGESLHRDTVLALELSRVTAELLKVGQSMEVFRRSVMDELKDLKTAMGEMQTTIKTLQQQQQHERPTAGSILSESPQQHVSLRKTMSSSSYAPPSPHLQHQSLSAGASSTGNTGSASVPPSPRSSHSSTTTSKQHLRRASVSEVSLPQHQARVRGAGAGAMVSPHLGPQHHQTHHPSAGVLYSAQVQPSTNVGWQPRGPISSHPPSSLPSPQQAQMHVRSSSLSSPVNTRGTIQHPGRVGEHPHQGNAVQMRPHEWHGSDTLFFPPLSAVTRTGSIKSEPAVAHPTIRQSLSNQNLMPQQPYLSSSSSTPTSAMESQMAMNAVPTSSLIRPTTTVGLISPETFVLPPMINQAVLPVDPLCASLLSKGIATFVEHCKTQRMLRSSPEQAALESVRIVVQSVWPRARVKGYGSSVTGLSLPQSDMDVVVCLPKVNVMREAIAEEVGPLEGHTADERMSWQQKLAAALIQAPWVDPDSLRTIQHAPMPVIMLTTRGPPYFDVPISLDVTFQSETHHGLATNKLVNALQREHRMLRPLVLVLKQFLADRGLGKGFSGGLSSYALVIMCTCFLYATSQQLGLPSTSASSPKEESTGGATSVSPTGAMEEGTNEPVVEAAADGSKQQDANNDLEEAIDDELGVLLVCFLRFFGEHFDPRNTGISLTRGFFPRNISASLSSHVASQQQSQSGTTAAQYHQQRRRSFRIEDLQPDIGVLHHHGPFGLAPPLGPDVVPPHKFDPLLIEDPLQPGNNVGRNVFRIHQIQRACADTAQSLRIPHAAGWPVACVIGSWNPSGPNGGSSIIPPPPTPLLHEESTMVVGKRLTKMVPRSNSVV